MNRLADRIEQMEDELGVVLPLDVELEMQEHFGVFTNL